MKQVFMESPEEALRRLGTDGTNGLTPEQVAESRRLYGSNALTGKKPDSLLKRIWNASCEPMLVMLIGLASKNAILMVEFAKQEREAGVGIDEAAIGGGRARYRAVLMTAYSFVIGVFPMVIATGAGAGSRRAIGVTTFCGMVLATLVGIVFIPALYSICQRLREKGHAMFEKHK